MPRHKEQVLFSIMDELNRQEGDRLSSLATFSRNAATAIKIAGATMPVARSCLISSARNLAEMCDPGDKRDPRRPARSGSGANRRPFSRRDHVCLGHFSLRRQP